MNVNHVMNIDHAHQMPNLNGNLGKSLASAYLDGTKSAVRTSTHIVRKRTKFGLSGESLHPGIFNAYRSLAWVSVWFKTNGGFTSWFERPYLAVREIT